MKRRFLSLCLLLLIVLLVLEVGIRVVNKINPFVNTKFWKSDPLLGIRYIPNIKGIFVRPEYKTVFSINSAGWRDGEHSLTKPVGVYRIVVLGDSFVESFQVPLEKTFFKILENQLNQKLGSNKIEVIALGIGGSSPTQQYFALLSEGLKYDPDLVIQAFYTQNDTIANSKKLSFSPYRGYFTFTGETLKYESAQTTREENDAKTKPLFVFFRERSLLWNYISDLLTIWRQSKLQSSFATSELGYPIDYQIYNTKHDDSWEEAWDITRQVLLKTKEAVEKAKSNYLLVSLANIEQIEINYRQQISKQYPKLDESSLDFTRPEIVLKEFTKQHQINYLSLVPTFYEYKKAHPQVKLYYQQDTHWNAQGYKIAGEAIAHYLLNSRILSR